MTLSGVAGLMSDLALSEYNATLNHGNSPIPTQWGGHGVIANFRGPTVLMKPKHDMQYHDIS